MMTSGPTVRSPGSGIFGTGPARKDSSAQEKTCGFPGLPAGPDGLAAGFEGLAVGLVAGPVGRAPLEAAPPVHPARVTQARIGATKSRRRSITAFCSLPRDPSPRLTLTRCEAVDRTRHVQHRG